MRHTKGNIMKKTTYHLIIACFIIFFLAFAPEVGHAAKKKAARSKKQKASSPVSLLLKKIEKRYDASSFSAHFYQESPLPEIQVTETAEGKAYFKRPGKFRWEYEKPEVLHYISDGKTLWIHSPSDNNVWTGKSKEFFGKGSSANVLTDVRQIRRQFVVSIVESTDANTSRLKLVPRNKSMGFTDIFLSIDKKTYDILKIVSFNMNGEETRIVFSDLAFQPLNDATSFSFTVPANANVIPLEQEGVKEKP